MKSLDCLSITEIYSLIDAGLLDESRVVCYYNNTQWDDMEDE